MSASSKFRKYFSKQNLKQIYHSSVRYRSPVGIDRINTKSFESNLSENINVIYHKVRNGTYCFSRYREKLLSRGQQKYPRVISIPTLRDKVTQKALFEVLQDLYGQSSPFLHKVIANVISSLSTAQYDNFLRLDVKNFYPSIRHDLLLAEIHKKIRKKVILNLIKDAISKPTVPMSEPRMKVSPNIGVPQGLSISNILADIYMSPVDSKHSANSSYDYFRYVDDILILCHSTETQSILQDITADCESLGLNLHPQDDDTSKTSSGRIPDSFSYLGYSFHPSVITVRKNPIDHLRESIIKLFTSYKYLGNRVTAQLKWNLDLRITGCIFNKTKYGWLFFFSQIDDLRLLNSLDHFVNKQCIRFGINTTDLNPKKFVRAYHEITRNISRTNYIPNFDTISVNEKRKLLTKIFKLETPLMTKNDIEYQFSKRIYRTIRDLEKDLARPS